MRAEDDATLVDVRFRVHGRLGRVTLTRPAALNALTLPMIQEMYRVLRQWEERDDITVVLLEGSGGRAFCAGGDIVAVHSALTATPPDHASPQELWRHQHELNVLLADYRKPVVSLLEGVVLGGGVGLGCHVRHRVVTETTRIGMPETSLGLAPDVGALHLLARSAHHMGDHFALTGNMFGPKFAVSVGLADVIITSDELDGIAAELAGGVPPAEALQALSVGYDEVGPGPGLESSRTDIEEMAWCYDSDDINTILQRLEECGSTWAGEAAERIARSAPLAVRTTLQVLRSPVVTDLMSTFVQDLRRNVNFSHHPDLMEGIRCSVVDKGATPSWAPSDLDEVSIEDVEACLAPFDGPDLDVGRVLQRA